MVSTAGKSSEGFRNRGDAFTHHRRSDHAREAARGHACARLRASTARRRTATTGPPPRPTGSGATLCEGVGTAVRDQMNDSSMGGPSPAESAPQKHRFLLALDATRREETSRTQACSRESSRPSPGSSEGHDATTPAVAARATTTAGVSACPGADRRVVTWRVVPGRCAVRDQMGVRFSRRVPGAPHALRGVRCGYGAGRAACAAGARWSSRGGRTWRR